MEKKRLLTRLEELIDEGQKLNYNSGVSFEQWRFSSETILKRIYPDRFNENDYMYIHTFVEYTDSAQERLMGLLKSTRDSLEKGLIGNIEHEVKRVEINNLLDYSYELFDENNDALDRCACVLSRIVLERTLKILCEKNQIEFDSKTKVSTLNHKLRESGVYSVSEMKEVDYLLSIGNYASHSGDEWEKTKPQQRRKAVRGVEDFFKRFV